MYDTFVEEVQKNNSSIISLLNGVLKLKESSLETHWPLTYWFVKAKDSGQFFPDVEIDWCEQCLSLIGFDPTKKVPLVYAFDNMKKIGTFKPQF